MTPSIDARAPPLPDPREFPNPPDFIDWFVSGFLGLIWISETVSLTRHCYKLYHLLRPSTPLAERSVEIKKVARKVVTGAISTTGAGAYFIYWGHQIKVISLGVYAKLCQGIGYTCSLLISGIEMVRRLFKRHKIAAMRQTARTQGEVDHLDRKQRLNLLNLAASISSVVWGVLSLIPMITGVIISSTISLVALGCWALFIIIAGLYRRHIKERIPAPATG